jgi:hypothetical protein
MKGADIGIIIHPPIETKDLNKEEEKHLSYRVEEIIRGGVEELQGK